MRKETQTLGRSTEVFESLAEQSSDLMLLASPGGDVLFLNAAGSSLLDVESRVAEGMRLLDVFSEADNAFAREVILADVAREQRWHGDYRLRNFATGAPVFVDLEVFAITNPAGETVAIAAAARDISKRRRSETRLRALVDAGAALSHALEDPRAFETLAELIVRTLATLCVIEIVPDPSDEHPGPWQAASFHIDRTAREVVAAGTILEPIDFSEEVPTIRVMRDGTSILVAHVDEAWFENASIDPQYADWLRSLGVHSLVAVPLVAGGKVLGALTVARAKEQEPRAGFLGAYDAEDLFFVEELGRRAGAAVEGARLYERQRNIAVRMQEASLPERLPSLANVQLAAEYRPGSAAATIGGDWYDAFVLDDGRLALTIGDVLGHGLDAAVTMGKLRQAMQAAAMVDPDPRVMLEVADKTLHLHDANGFATALAAIFDPRSRSLTFVTAGHPAPFLRHSDGRVDELESTGLMLGVRSGVDRPVVTVELPEICALVFYTDGLVEATRDINEGHARLRAALAREDPAAHVLPARRLTDSALAGEDARDDIAVLVALIGPTPA
jgi:PAS domain S-box-containing protein